MNMLKELDAPSWALPAERLSHLPEKTAAAFPIGAFQKNALVKDGPPEIETAWVAMLEKLESFRLLGDDWDGQGARGPTDGIVDSAIALLKIYRERGDLSPPSAVAPNPDGSVLIVWQGMDGAYGEIEVVRPFYAEVMLKQPGQATRHWTLPS